jgi:hypothetical protein
MHFPELKVAIFLPASLRVSTVREKVDGRKLFNGAYALGGRDLARSGMRAS